MAYKISGPGSNQYALLEIHYDNPNSAQGTIGNITVRQSMISCILTLDIIDQSGITFYYTEVAEKVNHLAGIMVVGHHITPNMLIPPQLDTYSIAGLCSGDCTDKVVCDAPTHGLLNCY